MVDVTQQDTAPQHQARGDEARLLLRQNFAALDAATAAAITEEIGRLAPLRTEFRRSAPPEGRGRPALVTTADLRAMAQLQELFFDHHFVSHRPVIGPIIVALKRTAVACLNKILRLSLVRQTELNQHTWNLALSVQQLEQRLAQLEERLQVQEGGHRP